MYTLMLMNLLCTEFKQMKKDRKRNSWRFSLVVIMWSWLLHLEIVVFLLPPCSPKISPKGAKN